jgi:hypothetical protein
MRKLQTWRMAAGAASVLLPGLLTGCGSGDGSAKAADIGQHKVTITSPADGATVGMPFTLKFSTSVPIGPTDTGRGHVHVIIDRHTDDYTVVTTPTYTITDLPPGKHVVDVTLQHADHSPDGASAEITVNVGGSGGAATTPASKPEPAGGGYGGGY